MTTPVRSYVSFEPVIKLTKDISFVELVSKKLILTDNPCKILNMDRNGYKVHQRRPR